MIRFLTIRIALLLAWLPLAGRADDFEFGPRPPLSVFDPKNVVDPAAAKEISSSLDHIRETEFVDVMVVVLDDIGAAPPEHVANQFAAAWCRTPIHAVVLHVPGHPEGPWIVPAGKLTEYLKPEVIYTAISAAEDRASREPDDTRKVKAAATEAADRLRFWMSTAINRTEYLKEARTRIRLEQETKSRQRQLAMLTVAALAIPVLVGICALIFLLRKPSPRRFPNANPPRRLGAPHAGGNHATLVLAPPAGNGSSTGTEASAAPPAPTMKPILPVLLAALLLSACQSEKDQAAPPPSAADTALIQQDTPILPVQIGDAWIYEVHLEIPADVTSAGAAAVDTRHQRSRTYLGKVAAADGLPETDCFEIQVPGSAKEREFVDIREDRILMRGSLILRKETTQPMWLATPIPFIIAGAKPGTSLPELKTTDGSLSRKTEIIAREDITVPAGTFPSIRMLTTGSDGDIELRRTLWFAPGKGIIREEKTRYRHDQLIYRETHQLRELKKAP